MRRGLLVSLQPLARPQLSTIRTRGARRGNSHSKREAFVWALNPFVRPWILEIAAEFEPRRIRGEFLEH